MCILIFPLMAAQTSFTLMFLFVWYSMPWHVEEVYSFASASSYLLINQWNCRYRGLVTIYSLINASTVCPCFVYHVWRSQSNSTFQTSKIWNRAARRGWGGGPGKFPRGHYEKNSYLWEEYIKLTKGRHGHPSHSVGSAIGWQRVQVLPCTPVILTPFVLWFSSALLRSMFYRDSMLFPNHLRSHLNNLP